MDNQRYPIGQFELPEAITVQEIQQWIEDIQTFPVRLKGATADLTEEQLSATYREGSWTVRQLVHHMADSHLHLFIRCKLALTEENPQVKTFDENSWVLLADSAMPIESSLAILDGLHSRGVELFHAISEEEMGMTFSHPETGDISIAESIAKWAWHGNHHLAHIENATKA
ncbi:MAG: YfiT family bacillithiol transferase [Lysinibacillus sp.]